ncbi:uncharacterized protein N7482_007719 [Penicillium canariense]|uniref:Serine/threonine-protein kinase ATG1 n=1 Tax=Penicillium canariense TaxID=189055 RepID=A0A9W9LK42_9EURO|nr:uncharacterized protein N7482_007719 [Penicillium canariense]KAJ5160715.1 hypothetical protein N7482_007719 [Penicillium canariense]
MDPRPSDLVLDSRIQVEFSTNFTYRFTVQSKVSSTRHVRRRQHKETWQVEYLPSECQAELQAVKMIKKAVVSDGIDYYKELEAIAKFSQKKYEGLFVEFIGWYESDDSVFIAMEYMEHGDLDVHLNAPLPEPEAQEITLQIAEGLKLLHENGFAHRDLKPANIFVFRKGPDWWVKIGDFGFSKRVTEKDGLQTWVGTPVFLAPEVQMLYSSGMNDDDTLYHYTEKVDIWALGVITFYMIFHEYPFTPRKPIGLLQYVQGADLPFPKSSRSGISHGCISFIKAAMAPNASNRLSAKEAIESEWLRRADIPVAEIASLQISERKLPDSASVQNLEDARLGPTQGPSMGAVNKGNSISPTCADMPAHEMQVSPGSSAREGCTTSESEPSPTQETRTGSASHKDAVQLQLDRLQSIHTQGVQLFRRKFFREAEDKLRHAAKARKKLLTLKHSDTRNSYHCLGVLYYHMSKYSQAEQLFQWVLEVQEKLYGPRNQSTLKSRYWIGVVMIRDGRLQEGMAVLQSVVKLQQDVLGPNHPETLLTLSEIEQQKPTPTLGLQGSTSSQQNSASLQLLEIEKATESMQKSIRELKSRLGPISPRCQELRKIARVRLPFHLPRFPPILKDDSHPYKVKIHYRTMAELGQRLHGHGDYHVAQDKLELAVKGLKEVFGPTHTEPLKALYWLGRNQYELGQYKIAEDLFREVMDGFTKSLGKSDRETLNALHATALALSKQGKYKEAESIFLSAFNGFKQKYGSSDQDAMRSLFQRGFVLCKQKEFKQAVSILEKAHRGLRHFTGPRSDETTECAYWLERASRRCGGTIKSKKFRVRLPPPGSNTARTDQQAIG